MELIVQNNKYLLKNVSQQRTTLINYYSMSMGILEFRRSPWSLEQA